MSEISQKQSESSRPNAKKKSGKATESRALVQRMTAEDLRLANEALAEQEKVNPEELKLVKHFLKGVAYPGGDPVKIVPKIAEMLLASVKTKRVNYEAIKEAVGTITGDINKALVTYGLENHYPLSQSVEKELRPQAIKFSHQLIQEYDCKTSGEKALAEIVVGAYANILRQSRILNNITSNPITQRHTGLYSVISKELDRANRHFITALTTLKQFKAPSLEISVKAKTAFVAKNQQINATNNPTNKENEIIDPK